MNIVTVRAREILDSRGRPTVEAEIELDGGVRVVASVPSGASTGRHEAVELRDRDPGRYRGLGVRKAVAAINDEIAPAIRGRAPDQAMTDAALIALDGTPDKSRLGANAILAVSLATARAAAATANQPLWRHFAEDDIPQLPIPMVNIISGGLHAGRQLDFQDFLVIPIGAHTYSAALEMVIGVHGSVGDLLAKRNLSTLKADEGGYGPRLRSHAEALEIIQEGAERAGLRPGVDIAYAIDVAATHFYDTATGTYQLASEDRSVDADGLADILEELVTRYPVISLEDPLAEDDWDGWSQLTARLGERVQVVGDDLFTTNLARLNRGIESGAGNAVLVKMNQIGTVTETLAVIERAREAGMRTVISARSGETEDPALADLAVGAHGGQIKIGSITRSERLAKYNQLLRIEEWLGSDARYAGPWAMAEGAR